VPYYFGPYIVMDKISKVNYIVEARIGKKVFRETVHVEKIKPYFSREVDEFKIPEPADRSDAASQEAKTDKSKTQATKLTQQEESMPPKRKQVKNSNYANSVSEEFSESAELPAPRYNLRVGKGVSYKY